MPGIKIVDYICDIEERHPDIIKVIKILKQIYCDDISEARAFINIYMYFGIQIKDFAIVVAAIYRLFRKDILFK